MGFAQTRWAWQCEGLKSSERLVLLALADHTRGQGNECWPSTKRLCDMTGLHRETVFATLRTLEERRLIRIDRADGRVHRYELQRSQNRSEKPDYHQSEKPDRSKLNQSEKPDHPSPEKRTTTSPVFPTRKLVKEPGKEAGTTKTPRFALPDWIPKGAWSAFEEMRRAHGKPLKTDRARELIVAKLATLKDAGNDPAAVLEESTMNSWQSVYPLKARAGNAKRSNLEDQDYTRGAL